MSIYQNFDGSFITDCKTKRKNFYIKNHDKIQDLMKIVYWAQTEKEAIKCFERNIQEPPKCLCCGNFPGFVSNWSIGLYRSFCTQEHCQKVRHLQSHTPEAVAKREATCLANNGYTNPFKSKEKQNEIKESYYQKHGVYNCMHLDSVKNKRKDTLIERYGVDNVSKLDDVKEQKKRTWLDKYGYDNPLKSPEIQDKIKKIFDLRYGGYPLSNIEVRNKSKTTCLEKYGTDHHMKSESGLEHWRRSFYTKYGENHPMHIPEVVEKQNKSSKSLRTYISESGKQYKLQGYEHFAVELLESLDIHFLNTKSEVGSIDYTMDQNKRKYYPDFRLTGFDTYIEVKSEYTYAKDEYKLECIKKSNPDLNLIVLVYNNSGLLVDVIQ